MSNNLIKKKLRHAKKLENMTHIEKSINGNQLRNYTDDRIIDKDTKAGINDLSL